MKRLLSLFVAVALCACTSGNKEDIVVDFQVDNMTYSTVGALIDGTTAYQTELDKDGKGRIVIPGMENIYLHVVYGQSVRDIFLRKGEHVTVRFDARTFDEGIAVDGVHGSAAEYLQQAALPEAPSYELPWDAYRAAVGQCVESAMKLLKARKLDTRCPEFAAVEQERLKYLYAQGMIMYPMYRQLASDPDYRPGKEYYDALRELVVERGELADVEAYRNFLNFAISALLEEQSGERLDPTGRTEAVMKYIAEHFTNEKLRQKMLRMLALEHLEFADGRRTKQIRKLVNTYVTDPLMLRELRDEFARRDPKGVGHRSPDFEASDLEGKSYSLSDFSGKYLLIDLWATWCGPCKAEMPYLKALEKQFEGRNITFLGLSVDKDRKAWETMARSGELSGVQLYLGPGSAFQEDYEIEGIPHFILLDREGKILYANMARPSSNEVARLLEALEGI